MYRHFSRIRNKNINTFISIILLSLLVGYKAQAQSFGDPIVNITFGSGIDRYGGPLPADSGTTTYTYSGNTPNDNFYTIVNSSIYTNGGWWITTDHTGNPGGYFMLVNGDYSPGVFYTRTVSGLCGSTTYQFAAWIKNLLNYEGILPNVTFSIETPGGTVLGTANTNDIPTGNVWKQYPFTFTTPANTQTIVLKMINNAPGGNGNDIAIDDITFRPQGDPVAVVFDQTTTTTTVNNSCVGIPQTVVIKATSTLTANYQQKLQQQINGVWIDKTLASTSSEFTVTTPSVAGTYKYRVVSGQSDNINSSQCIVSSNELTLTVKINPLPVVDFTVPAVCQNDNFAAFSDKSTIADNTETGFTYLWNFGDPASGSLNTSTLKNPLHSYHIAGDYQVSLTVTSGNNCPETKIKTFTVNGNTPFAVFNVLNSAQLCSNREVLIVNNSTVYPGNVSKIQLYYDHDGDLTLMEEDNNPTQGKIYHHTYPEFHSGTKSYKIVMIAYSGGVCFSVPVEQTITLLPAPLLTFNTVGPVCKSDGAIQLVAKDGSGLAGSGVYSGTGVNSSGLFDPDVAGVGTFTIKYTYTVNNTICENVISQDIIVNPLPTVTAGTDISILEGGSATLHAATTGTGLTYAWLPTTGLSNTAIANPVVTGVSGNITYTVTVTNDKGCIATDDIKVAVLKTPVIPNAFTPNGDGINDTWDIQYLNTYVDCTVDVFNRNGQKVYTSIGYSTPWDGRWKNANLTMGVYYYLINPKHGLKAISGYITIIR